jgi:hypothetical protein
LRPERSKIIVDGTNITRVLGQGALRDPDPVRRDVPGRCPVRLDEPLRQHCFPLREHTKKKRRDPQIVMEKLELVGGR